MATHVALLRSVCALVVLIGACEVRADNVSGLSGAALGAGIGVVAGSVGGVVTGIAVAASGGSVIDSSGDDAFARASVNAAIFGVGAGVVGGAVGGAIGGAVDDGADGSVAGGGGALVGSVAGVAVVATLPAALVVYGALANDPSFDVAGAIVAVAVAAAIIPGGSLILFLPAGSAMMGASLLVCLFNDVCDVAAQSVMPARRHLQPIDVDDTPLTTSQVPSVKAQRAE